MSLVLFTKIKIIVLWEKNLPHKQTQDTLVLPQRLLQEQCLATGCQGNCCVELPENQELLEITNIVKALRAHLPALTKVYTTNDLDEISSPFIHNSTVFAKNHLQDLVVNLQYPAAGIFTTLR